MAEAIKASLIYPARGIRDEARCVCLHPAKTSAAVDGGEQKRSYLVTGGVAGGGSWGRWRQQRVGALIISTITVSIFFTSH